MKKESGLVGFVCLAVVIILYVVVYTIQRDQYRREEEASYHFKMTELARYTATQPPAAITPGPGVTITPTQESEWKWEYVLVPNPYYDSAECMTYRLAPWVWFPIGNAKCDESTILEWRKVHR